MIFKIFKVKQTKINNRCRRKENIIKLEHKRIIKGLATISRPNAKEILDKDIQDILMNTIQDKHGISPVSFPSMYEKQGFQEFKLSNRKVCTPRGLLPLLAENSNANMCCLDHGNIIGSISNAQSDLAGESVPDHVDYVSLLFGGDSACQDHIY